jgi:hypothetical protein
MGNTSITGDDSTTGPSSGLTPTPSDPAEGRPDVGGPGADRETPSGGQGDDLPEQLGRRISEGPGGGIAGGEPDVFPDVEPPEATM